MRDAYRDWIMLHFPTAQSATGKCKEAASMMCEQFKELRLTRGLYECWQWGDREHWWCVASDGTIVDPTSIQFPTAGNCSYREVTDFDESPIGKCMNCGAYNYRSNGGDSYSCSDSCRSELHSQYNGFV